MSVKYIHDLYFMMPCPLICKAVSASVFAYFSSKAAKPKEECYLMHDCCGLKKPDQFQLQI